MHLPGVRPSVRLSFCVSVICPTRPPHVVTAGLLLRARRAGDINRLPHGVTVGVQPANAGSAALSAYVIAEH